MEAWVSRTFAAIAAVFAGALLGGVIGGLLRWPIAGVVGGAISVVGLWALRDSVHGERLMRWLRGSQDGTAPRDTGFWGELAYRIERALRSRDAAIEAERQRLDQFLSAIEASPNGVMLLDANDQIEWLNSVAAEHFGLDPARDRRQRATNLIRTPAFVAHLQAGVFGEPVTFTGPTGAMGRAGLATLAVVVRPYGEGSKLVLSQDITERERADAMRRDFVANVSHEIRTPLTVLAGFVETLAQLPLTEPERRRVLALMEQQTGRMQALVADLLTLAQLEGSPRPGHDRWIAIGPLLQRVKADALALSAGRHTITVNGGEDAELAGLEQELISAFGNLLTNAVRYTPEGGTIEMRWHWRPGHDAESDATGGAVLEVTDTGIGIAREHLPRLTERFYRVDGSRSRETGGTGLGLAIVKHIVQRHGGAIEIDSEVGKGSTFRLVFPTPRVRRREVAAAETAPVAASG